MSTPSDLTGKTVSWLEQLEQLLGGNAQLCFRDLFLEDSYWRDLVSLTWDTRQFWGGAQVEPMLLKHARAAGMRDLRLDPDRSAPVQAVIDGVVFIEAFFAFTVEVGKGKGFLRLQVGEGGAELRAQIIATSLVSLDIAPDVAQRHPGHGYEPEYPGQTFSEWRRAKGDFSGADPDVLIVGGSQSGVSLGARFERKGFTSYLIVDRSASPGDTWRKRYDALALHTNTPANDLPYLKLPSHWGEFLSKDQWADWLDSYARLMNLNCSYSTELVSGSFDEGSKTWEVVLRTADGDLRTLRPKHVVMAIGGVGGKPRIPGFPGLDQFQGEVLHSSRYKNGKRFKGQKVWVVGSSTTAHDICLDLYHSDASPTMVQRGATCVVGIQEVQKFTADYLKVSVEEADQRRDSTFILPLLVKRTQGVTAQSDIEYAELHEGLRKAGQKLTIGEDRTGWLMKLFRDLAGYYLNVGCSDAIISGGVKVLDFNRIDHFIANGARLHDGEVVEFDALVLATGYEDQSVDIAGIFGPEMARKIGRGIGLNEEGEYRNMARPTGQPHLWMMLGGIIDARKSSDVLAMQIIAQLRGLVPTLVRQASGSVAPLQADLQTTGEAISGQA
ncbi:flavin-containing monooxygenase [Pusillimonas noertemannii]|uniref:flavin-containing monooxygenase n=1 Tax=Pusillimonas noertemannii TaxID=305977 RepID=UPI00030E8A23|nr:NAD(P)/FAD-dependent oxidoreductase [Pusillimonas noertemannii]